MKLVIICIIVLLINIPFGYWRSNVKKLSLQWFLAIHLPVPAVVLLRIYSGLGFEFITYPVIIGSYFLGQFAGSRLNRYIKKAAAEKG